MMGEVIIYLIQTVDLGENRINDASIKLIGDALKTHVRLHMLFLDNNKITDAGADGLAECLKNKQDLRILNIDNNQIGPEGTKKLST